MRALFEYVVYNEEEMQEYDGLINKRLDFILDLSTDDYN